MFSVSPPLVNRKPADTVKNSIKTYCNIIDYIYNSTYQHVSSLIHEAAGVHHSKGCNEHYVPF